MFIWDFVAGTVLDALLDWLYDQVVGLLGTFFAVLGGMGLELFELEWVQAVIEFFSHLAWALFAISAVVACFEFAIEYSSGRGNIQQTSLNILKGFMAVGLFTTVPVRLYALSVSMQGTMAAGLTGLGSVTSLGEELVERLTTPEGLTKSILEYNFGFGIAKTAVMMVFCVIMMAYAVIKVFFANLKRGGILVIQIAVGSLYMFSIPRGYIDGFTQWMKQVLALCLTAFLQSTILVAGLLVLGDNLLLGLGLMLSAGEVPRIAGIFGLDTSTKASISSAVYTAQSVVNTTRTIASFVSGAA